MIDVCVCNYPNPGTDGMCDCDHPLEWHDGFGRCWPEDPEETPGHLDPADVPDGDR